MHSLMSRKAKGVAFLVCFIVISSNTATAQAAATAQQAPAAPPPPATKLEANKPAAGSIVTFGYDDLSNVAGISVDARELRDSKNVPVRGLVVQVYQSQYREERSFVDVDEIPELLKAIDALLEVKSNPTSFRSFEVRYTTRGELRLTAYNSSAGAIRFAVEAGRTLKASRSDLSDKDL